MELGALQSVLLAAAGERSVDAVLSTLVRGLAAQSGVALARVWMLAPGDICDTCRMRDQCPDQTVCLHLLASAGHPSKPGENWSRLDGSFRRFPLGVRKIGRVAASGEPILLSNLESEHEWLARPDWAADERLLAFAAQPLSFLGETLGVLAVFSREKLDPQDVAWLRLFADHAAASIANARAFEEIEMLRGKLQLENAYLREEVETALASGEVIGGSRELRRVLENVEMVAPTDANVLIQGESGTGKELIARAIHTRSSRRDRPLIKVNCASVPRDLFESEFFGHVKGAFTGAVKERVGRFQLADRGTLFLDEVGEIPLELQSKMLRVLQEGEFERVGDDRPRKVDVRIIAATNRDLQKEMQEGRFREDLYFRLDVFPIEVPPLREREGDVAPLAHHFTRLASKRFNKPVSRLSDDNLETLEAYDWPGNVRELQNVIERAVIRARSGKLEFDLAPARPTAKPAKAKRASVAPLSEVKAIERERILEALERTHWKIYGPGGAAELLGVKPTTLASRLKSLGIEKPS